MDQTDRAGNGVARNQIISLDLIVQITSALEHLVQGMLGPCHQQTLLSTHTGKALVTRDGLTILSSLHFSHPIARCIMQSLQSYYSLHRDGSKTFILYLSEALRAIRDELVKTGAQESLFRIQLSLELSKFLETDFWQIVSLVVDKGNLGSCSSKCDDALFVSVVRKIVTGSLYTCLQKPLVNHFTKFLVEFLSLRRLAGSEQRLAHIVQNFDMYHTKIFTQPHQMSRVCQGFLLETDLSACQSYAGIISPKQFALCEIDFDSDEKQRGGNKVSICLSSSKVADVFSYKRKCVDNLLNALKESCVDVVICSEKVPQYVLGMCKEKSIVVHITELEKIVFLSSVTGTSVLCELSQTVQRDHLFTANIRSFVHTGNKMYTLIEPDPRSCSVSPINHMIVCAPTEGMCGQLCQSLHKAVKAVSEGLQPNLLSAVSISSASPALVADERRCSDAGSLRSVPHGISTEDERVCESVEEKICEECGKEPKPLCMKIKMSTLTVGCGGAFEALMISSMCDYISGQNYLCRTRITSLIQKMLISVPKALLFNLSSSRHGRERQFTKAWTNLLSALQQGRVMGISSHGCVLESTETECLEPVVTKVSLMSHVLQLIVVLLRVESLVPVRTINNTPTDSDEEDSE